MADCSHLDQVDVAAKPSSDGCEDCLREGGRWLHLRMCRTCGHVGCCDSSPNKHASAHYASVGHPVMSSYEPGEDWVWCFQDEVALMVPDLPYVLTPVTAATTEGPAVSRAVILTVDDDPSVSRAVARDLRRQYGENHRVLRASSGAEAMDALRELKLRGEPVAVLLADYRMPEMNGIEFLESAMDLFPRARRALLTAYADTDAAIAAINVVDVDHYLLKPWEPPEEKLYPVVDAMLDAYLADGERQVPETKVVGHRWSAPSFEVRDFLARNAVPYRWFAVDEPEGRRLLDAAGADARPAARSSSPRTGETLVAPSTTEVAAAVGLSTTPTTDFYDLVVVGGGPAGLGAAVYGASEGLRTLLVERQATGGQAGQSSRIENYLGFPDGVSGAQLTDRARRQATKFGAEILTARDVTGLSARGPARVVQFSDGTEVAAHAVIVATGVSYRDLAAPGAVDLTGSGVYYGSASTEAADCVDADVYVVGGANSAGQSAVFFSRVAKSVTLVVRGPTRSSGRCRTTSSSSCTRSTTCRSASRPRSRSATATGTSRR